MLVSVILIAPAASIWSEAVILPAKVASCEESIVKALVSAVLNIIEADSTVSILKLPVPLW